MTTFSESLFTVAKPRQQCTRGTSRNAGLAMDRQGRNTSTPATRDASILDRVCAAHLPVFSR
ncbi:MAG TPA: hypothetical protein VGE36_22060 [Roseateles sp.]